MDVAIEWFQTNYFKLNTDKCKPIVVGHKSHPINMGVGASIIEEVSFVKLLAVTRYNKFNFNEHISKLLKNANSKLSVIKRGLNMLSYNKRTTLLNSFVQSQFSFPPLVWMLCGKDANKKEQGSL